MKIFLKIMAVVLLAGYLVAALVLFGNDDRTARCNHFEIIVTDSAQCNIINAAKITDHLAQAGLVPLGKAMQMVDTEQIEECVRRIGILHDVQCYHKRNGDVYLSVAQYRPVARVITDEGDDYYLDATGRSIAVDAKYLQYLPLILGCSDDTLAAADLLPLVQYVAGHPFWSAQVEHLYISPAHEVSVMPRVGDHTILLGSLQGYEEKLGRVLALYEQVMPRIGWAAYDTISVKYAGQVVCTRRDKNYKHQEWINNNL